jgi:hypothetical protein
LAHLTEQQQLIARAFQLPRKCNFIRLLLRNSREVGFAALAGSLMLEWINFFVGF